MFEGNWFHAYTPACPRSLSYAILQIGMYRTCRLFMLAPCAGPGTESRAEEIVDLTKDEIIDLTKDDVSERVCLVTTCTPLAC